jgi:3-oxoacyl-[acyl-carrier protein] reductase
MVIDIDERKIEETCKDLRENGCGCSAFRCDVTNYGEVQKTVGKILEEYGKIDILINNAGVLQTKPFPDLTEADWDFVMNVNLKGTFNFCKAVYNCMKNQRSGRIISMGSLAGKSGGISVSANYAVSKSGVMVLTRCLARDLAPYGVTVNCIAPGLTETKMSEVFSAQQKQKVVDGIPIGRLAEPEEIANLVLFLCSDMSNYITGETININGGLLMD